MAQQIVIGIDPDVTANGVACVDVAARSVKATTMPFPDLLDYLRSTKREADTQGRPLHVIIEAGWLNRSNPHNKRGGQMARDKPCQKPDRRANANVVNEIKSYEKKHIKQ